MKQDTSKHVCSNCKISPQFKNNAQRHQSNSVSCPVFIKETETVIKKTAGISTNDFLRHQAKLRNRQINLKSSP